MRSYLFATTLLFCFSLWSDQTITYQSSTDGIHTQTKWSLADTLKQVEIFGQNRGNEIQLKYSPTFDLIHYFEKDSKKPIFEIQKEGDVLSIKNNAKSKTLKLGKLPWIQEFKFGFQPFLKSKDKELPFTIVYSKDTTLHDMIATKEKIEKVTVGDKTYEAQKLKITLQGFKKRFWKAEAWFDVKTNLMVKYTSNEGPGTPSIEVTLLPS
jgi:hypothetical protein